MILFYKIKINQVLFIFPVMERGMNIYKLINKIAYFL